MTAAMDKPSRKPRPKPPVSVLVEREFVGDMTIVEAMIPVIFEDLRRKSEQIRTFEKTDDSA
jgi:hypothetical protein